MAQIEAALARIERRQREHGRALAELLAESDIQLDLEVLQIMDAAELQSHLEEKIAENATAVEEVGERVTATITALEEAIKNAEASGVNVEALDAALDNVKAQADAIDAAKTE